MQTEANTRAEKSAWDWSRTGLPANCVVLVERMEDELPFGGAWIADEDGRLDARALIGGVECRIDTKPSLLAAGVAVCIPVDVATALNWPMHVRVAVEGREQIIECATADPLTVAAARRFYELAASGRARVGMRL